MQNIPLTISKKALTELLKISYPTLNAWLDKIPGLYHQRRRIFNPLETKKIFSHFDLFQNNSDNSI